MADREKHLYYLRRCIEVSRIARETGNTPFGSILVDREGVILLEQGNVEITQSNCTGHAEATLMVAASKRFSKEMLQTCTLYSTAEPCAMCSGAIYWGNVGSVVYGISEKRLAALTGDDEQNPTLDLPCRAVFAAGRKSISVTGPFLELEEEVVSVHEGFWL